MPLKSNLAAYVQSLDLETTLAQLCHTPVNLLPSARYCDTVTPSYEAAILLLS
jgi:hypothetical protein